MPGTTVRIPVARAFQPLLEPSRYKGAHGGRGSAKSHFFAGLAVETAAFDGAKVLCLREFQKSIGMSVKPLLESKIKEYGLDEYFEIQEQRIKSVRGGGFIFEGMQSHNAHSIKSFEDFDIAWFEEAHTATQRSLDILRPTLRKEGSELWFSWNPDQPTDPIQFLVNDPPADSRVVQVNWRDNPWFPRVLRAELEYDRRRDPDKFAHVWEGGFRKSNTARVFRNWKVEEFDSSTIEGLEGPYGGADWGFSVDPTVLIVAWVDQENRRIYVEREVWAIGCSIQDTPELFDRVLNEVPDGRNTRIRADSARPETIDHMKRAGFPRIRGARKGAGSVEDGIEFLKGYDIIVHPRCRHVEDELTHYSWKLDKLTGEPTNELADKKNHTIDSLRYALENVRRSIHQFW